MTTRTRRIFITESRKCRAVRIETYSRDGKQVAGTLHLFRDDLPAFLAALTEAAAAIGVEIPAKPAPQSDGAALAHHLTRARAL